MNKKQLQKIVFDLNISPYDRLVHYFSVASAFEKQTKSNNVCYPVALFHDLIEDKYISLQELAKQAELDEEQVYALDAITRREGEWYFDYIARVKQNKIATKVKIADLSNNIMRCACNLAKYFTRMKRYMEAYEILKRGTKINE